MRGSSVGFLDHIRESATGWRRRCLLASFLEKSDPKHSELIIWLYEKVGIQGTVDYLENFGDGDNAPTLLEFLDCWSLGLLIAEDNEFRYFCRRSRRPMSKFLTNFGRIAKGVSEDQHESLIRVMRSVVAIN